MRALTIAELRDEMNHPGVQERRSEPRYATHDQYIEVNMPDVAIQCHAQIMDVSRSGLRLRSRTYLNPSKSVILGFSNFTIEGHICHCSINEVGTFDSGVRIEDLRLSA